MPRPKRTAIRDELIKLLSDLLRDHTTSLNVEVNIHQRQAHLMYCNVLGRFNPDLGVVSKQLLLTECYTIIRTYIETLWVTPLEYDINIFGADKASPGPYGLGQYKAASRDPHETMELEFDSHMSAKYKIESFLLEINTLQQTWSFSSPSLTGGSTQIAYTNVPVHQGNTLTGNMPLPAGSSNLTTVVDPSTGREWTIPPDSALYDLYDMAKNSS